METPEPYHYAKTPHQLPGFQSFACKKSDIDVLLPANTERVPFKTLRLTKHGGLKKNKIEDKILVAKATIDPERSDLTIYSVPRELAGKIRLLMKEHGLPKMLSTLKDWNSRSETWHQTRHSLALWFYSKTGDMAFEDEYLN